MEKVKELFKRVRSLSYLNNKLVIEGWIALNLVIIFFWFNDFSIFSGFIYIGFFLVLSTVNLILPRIIDKLIMFISVTVIYIYCIAQEIYFSAFQQYFLFSTALGARNEIVGVQSSVAELITPKVYWVIAVIFVQGIILAFFATKEKVNKKDYIACLIAGSICLMAGVGSFASIGFLLENQKAREDILHYYGTPHYFFNYIPNSNVVVDKFGVLGLFYRDTIGRVFIQHDSQYGISDELIIEVLERLEEVSEEPENKYTNIFEGKNLVIIQAESLMNIAIDENLTPTLFRLKEEGLVFTGFNAPLLYGSTSDTEFMANTSLVPVSTGEITYNEYNQNAYVTKLADMFTNKGYYSSSYHSNYGEYYSRDVMTTALGYDFFDMLKIGVDFLEKDADVLEKIKWIYNWSPQYFSYFITYNGHQPYEMSQCTGYSEEYFEKVEEQYPDISDEMKCYYTKNMDLDKGIERYVEDIINNDYEVVLLIFGDHYAKGLDVEGKESWTPLIIWEKDVEPVVISKRASTLDLLPTLANMFNLDFDKRTVFGRDIMSEKYEGFYFNNFGQIYTMDFSYDAKDNSIQLITDKYTEDEAREMINEYILRLNVSRTIVETDFFARYPEYGMK